MRSSASSSSKRPRKNFSVAAAVTALTATALLTGACTKINLGATEPAPFKLTQDVSAIFSTRPDPATHAFFLVKLKSAPLSQSLVSKNGVTSVDPTALKEIDDEQTAMLQKIQALSSDIKLVYRYRMILNGFAIVAPTALQEKIGALAGVSHLEAAGNFERPVLPKGDISLVPKGDISRLPSEDAPAAKTLSSTIQQRNSVKFIGGEEAHARGIRGQGIKVGIIDTGIDYTHAMFGGAGTEAAYKAVDPTQPNAGFPNAKVVGGVDLVGTQYDSAAVDFNRTVPLMDTNPLDEAGHGSHVAGTVAGHGDGLNTYDGVAPDASLYAIKVFGANGSTSDTVVIAAMEFAADPNGDGDISDRLDVVNLSLGSGYGNGHILYTEAIRNLTTEGTSVVCSGGNSGDISYIVGSPGVAEDALSVAASVDDMDQNWKFRAAKFTTVDNPEIFVEAIEGNITKSIADAGSILGPLVPAGLADQDFTPEMSSKIAGKIAFIDRGAVSFVDKIRRAQEAGAIGVVVANNQPGAPIAMGGDVEKPFDIPAIMITKDFGAELKAALLKGDVIAELTTPNMIEKPELIDIMAGFSSRGPRSIDALLKPEISAPGSLIISAKMGGGAAGVQLSGTSMASPHMAGVMALMKQTHPTLSAAELKSLVMETSKTMVDEKKEMYPIARQGAGRVQVIKALEAPIVTLPSSISLGEITVETRKTMQRTVEVANISQAARTFNVSLAESTKGLSLTSAKALAVPVGQKATLDLRFTIDLQAINNALKANESNEISGFVLLSDSTGEVARIPVIAIANKVARVEATQLFVRSTSAADSAGAVVDLTLTNKGLNAGDAYPFNFLGRGTRKADPTLDPFRTKVCDLAESGYRVIQKNGVATLQIAAKVFEPMTTWDLCDVSVLIDSDGDFKADQELAGIKQSHLEGLSASTYSSILLDVKTAAEIRHEYDAAVTAPPVEPEPGQPKPAAPVLDFTPAIEALAPMLAFEHSTISILEVPIANLKLKSSGALAIRIATSAQTGSAIEPDDFLSKDPKKWKALNVSVGGAGYVDLPEKITVGAGETKTVSFAKGAGSDSLWIAYPNGKPVVGSFNHDAQSETVRAAYKP
jgi:minor extracellular serine protease Vpr